MDKYIITIKAANRTYAFGRYYKYDHERAIALDILEALFHLHLIDEFNIKEAPRDIHAAIRELHNERATKE